MPDPVYVLVPGYVRSRSDGDVHYVGAAALARLYGVPLNRCLVSGEKLRRIPEKAVFLEPRSDGNYSIPATLWENGEKPHR